MYRSTQFSPPPGPGPKNHHPYMYPPRPYPPSVPNQPPVANFTQQANAMVYSPQVQKPKGAYVKNIMNGFTDQNGQIDVQKTMATVDTAMKTYQQVSPMIKQITSFFTTVRS
ncbi:YppG family protein [Geomicrobium sp. JCM 19039]|uniref:YppG family protein n=1 Tax=Geomicrobium sp. JCM 19039 TaxID=1460636 RepID=UPI0005AB16E3|nr:YppG family protein [Geomicrobium sp. JCM 19039]